MSPPARALPESYWPESVLRIVDLCGNQAVDTLFFDAHDYANRYSAVDTLREQGSVYLGRGSRLLALDGKPLVSIVADTCGRHDTLGGACSQESNVIRYGEHTRHMHACRNTFIAQAQRLGARARQARSERKRELLHERAAHARRAASSSSTDSQAPASTSSCSAERDTLVLISNCPAAQQPLQRLRTYAGAVAGLAHHERDRSTRPRHAHDDPGLAGTDRLLGGRRAALGADGRLARTGSGIACSATRPTRLGWRSR